MKKYFFTGLAILLPIALTVFIILFVLTFLTAPFMGIAESLLGNLPAFERSYVIFSGEELRIFVSKIFALAVLFVCILALGLLGRFVFGVRLLQIADRQIRRIPLINKLYVTVQDTVLMVFNAQKASFSQVILVPYPHPKALSLALLPEKQPEEMDNDSLAVFMAGAAIPAMGLMMVYKKKDVIYLDMKVEDALKTLFSCGVVFPEIKKVPNAETKYEFDDKP